MTATTPLRFALAANALFSGLSGLALVSFPRPIATTLLRIDTIWPGVAAPVAFLVVGIGLVGFATFLAWLALRAVPPRGLVREVVLADLAWVGGTVLVLALAAGHFSPVGIAVIVGVAAVVAGLAALQWRGMKAAST